MPATPKHPVPCLLNAWWMFVIFCLCAVVIPLCQARAEEAGPAAPPQAANYWDPAPETLVLYNPNFEHSEELARFYAEKRGISPDHLVPIPCSKEETITRKDFEESIRRPLIQKLLENEWWRREKRDVIDPKGRRLGQEEAVVEVKVRVLVLMRGMPLRISRSDNAPDVKPMDADEASVDSELAALGPLMTRPVKGPLQNEYFQSTRRFPDSYISRGQFLVGRLDAREESTVRRMIEDTLAAEKHGLWGRAVLDFAIKEGPYFEGEQWLARCATMYHDDGIPFFVDRYPELIPDGWPLPETILYFGWYSSDIAGALASPPFRFKRGAIACHIHSFSAATLRAKDKGWVDPLLEHGAAAVLGNVWEPYLSLTTHLDVFNQRLLEGRTLGEAAWAATPAISWMTVVVGDPLYRPFPQVRPSPPDDASEAAYVVYRELSHRYLLHDEKKFRRELITLAEHQHRPSLYELVGLLSSSEALYSEASDFFQHARALYEASQDKFRCRLYDAELMRRKGKPEEGLRLVESLTHEPAYDKLPGINAALGLEKLLRVSMPQNKAVDGQGKGAGVTVPGE